MRDRPSQKATSAVTQDWIQEQINELKEPWKDLQGVTLRTRRDTLAAVVCFEVSPDWHCEKHQEHNTITLVLQLCVIQTLQRNGIGKALLNYVQQWARVQRHDAVGLQNAQAAWATRRFYEACGIKYIVRKSYLKKEALGFEERFMPLTLRGKEIPFLPFVYRALSIPLLCSIRVQYPSKNLTKCRAMSWGVFAQHFIKSGTVIMYMHSGVLCLSIFTGLVPRCSVTPGLLRLHGSLRLTAGTTLTHLHRAPDGMADPSVRC